MGKYFMRYYPTYVYQSILDIDYDMLLKLGKKIIIFDLDNTIISYFQTTPIKPIAILSEKLLNMGFQTFILTNNHEKRIKECLKVFKSTGYGILMRKPFTKRVNDFIIKHGFDKKEIIMIGDQLVTDVVCANGLGVDSILVKSIDRKSEHLYTRINRLRDGFIVRGLIKINPEYGKKIKEIVEKRKNINV